jgi:pimeloyl-ACP methyl ester carboxylesterase
MKQLRIAGTQIAFEDAGNGPTVMLLHGYPFNRSMWNEQIEALQAHHRVIAPDLRGHGETEVTASPATMEAMARDIATLLEMLEISRAVIGGLSMGGYVALAFCRQFPLITRALILADTRAQADTDEGKANRALQAEKALKEGMEGIADSMLPRLLAPETVTRRPDVVRRLREMMVSTPPAGAAAALAGMAQREDQLEFLARIICPVLIVVGRKDVITPVADSERMHHEIGGSRLEIIENAGHVSNLEQPAEFNRILQTFLRDLES